MCAYLVLAAFEVCENHDLNFSFWDLMALRWFRLPTLTCYFEIIPNTFREIYRYK